MCCVRSFVLCITGKVYFTAVVRSYYKLKLNNTYLFSSLYESVMLLPNMFIRVDGTTFEKGVESEETPAQN